MCKGSDTVIIIAMIRSVFSATSFFHEKTSGDAG